MARSSNFSDDSELTNSSTNRTSNLSGLAFKTSHVRDAVFMSQISLGTRYNMSNFGAPILDYYFQLEKETLYRIQLHEVD